MSSQSQQSNSTPANKTETLSRWVVNPDGKVIGSHVTFGSGDLPEKPSSPVDTNSVSRSSVSLSFRNPSFSRLRGASRQLALKEFNRMCDSVSSHDSLFNDIAQSLCPDCDWSNPEEREQVERAVASHLGEDENFKPVRPPSDLALWHIYKNQGKY